jgi:Predicted Zn-dependent protease (DUF2268)
MRWHLTLLVLLTVLILLDSSREMQDPKAPAMNPDPEAATISTVDVRLFWKAYDLWLNRDHAAGDKLAATLQAEYLDKASQGVKDFTPRRIASAQHLAEMIVKDRAYYDGVRRNTEHIEDFVPEIRAGMLALKKLYPDASFPTVYFVIGARNSGGTSSENALIIGSEMFGEGKGYPVQLEDVVPMVVHELVHFQQRGNTDSLLKAAMHEGAADFISEMAVGRDINERSKAYGDSHEQELWRRFQADIAANRGIGTWMYDRRPQPDGAPSDLGYYMGYKICQAYYQISKNKAEALKTIMEMRSAEQILKDSKYADRFQ